MTTGTMTGPEFDVVVAGAGPAGSAAARACAGRGLRVLLLEEHGTIGYPVQCAGLLSTAAMAACRVSGRSVLHRVRGAKLVSGKGSSLAFRAPDTKAVVVDRGALDREMAESAADAGAEIRLKTAVRGVQDHAVLTRGAGGREEIPYRILIAADGPRGTIARSLGMGRPRAFLSGIQADIPWEMDPDLVEIHPDVSPEFFGWVIPFGKNRARIGLCGCTGAKERFADFIRPFGGPRVHFVTGTLPLGIMPRTYGKRTLFVGDAAGFAKPTSGGGVYTGVRSAEHAAEVAARCCEEDRFDDAALADYERRWQEDIGRELALGFRIFRLRQHLTPDDIDALCRAMGDPSVTEAILQYGDMDRPGNLIRELLKKPALYRCMGILVKSGLRSLFT